MEEAARPTRKRLATLLVFAAVCGVYANHFHNGFHFDDSHAVVDNPSIRDLANLPRFFTDTTTFSVLPANRTWRPIVSVSLAIDYALGGGYVPFWFHLSTFLVFLSLLAAMLALFRAVLERASPQTAAQNRYAALVAVAWYGLHPAVAETVNYIIQRGDIYAAAGVTVALAIYIRFPRRRSTQLYLLPFALGLLSKPPALIFPALLFFYLLWFEPGERKPALGALQRTLPSLLVCAILLWLQSAHTPKSYTPSILSPWAYRITQPYVWLRYIGELFLPLHLNVDTDLGVFQSIDLRMLAGFVFVLSLLAAIVLTARKQTLRPIAFGLTWFALAELPTSLYPLSEVENDHRMFLAFIGLVLAVTWAGFLILQISILQRANPKATAAVITVLLTCYGFGTIERNRVWFDEETLWRDDVEKSPRNGRGLMNYGLVLMNRGGYQAALELFTQALVYTPNYATLEINLGVVNDALHRAGEAERHFQRALALAPGSDESHYYYARSLYQQQKLNPARREAEAAIALNPARLEPQELLKQIDAGEKNSDYWLDRSLAQYQEKQFAESSASARRALELKPDSAAAYNNLAAAAAAQQHWDEAIAAAQHAIRLQPDFQLAKNNLAWAIQGKAAQH